jgi:hypothetical protein
VSAPPLMVASELLDTVHCVPEVTSSVVLSLRCATALSVAAPPTLIVDGVAATLREFSVREGAVPHPEIRISMGQRHAEQVARVDETRMRYLKVAELRTSADWKQAGPGRDSRFASSGHAAVHQLFVRLWLLSRSGVTSDNDTEEALRKFVANCGRYKPARKHSVSSRDSRANARPLDGEARNRATADDSIGSPEARSKNQAHFPGRVPHVRQSVHGPKKMGAALSTPTLRVCPHAPAETRTSRRNRGCWELFLRTQTSPVRASPVQRSSGSRRQRGRDHCPG